MDEVDATKIKIEIEHTSVCELCLQCLIAIVREEQTDKEELQLKLEKYENKLEMKCEEIEAEVVTKEPTLTTIL